MQAPEQAPTMVPLISILWSLVIGIIVVVAIPALGWYIKSLIRNKEESEQKLRIAEKNEREEWQKGAIERSKTLAESLARIESCMATVKAEVRDKVNIEDCEKWSKEKWDRMNHHEHLIACDSPSCHVKKTAGVIISSAAQGG